MGSLKYQCLLLPSVIQFSFGRGFTFEKDNDLQNILETTSKEFQKNKVKLKTNVLLNCMT